ncbi:MAG: hypothetical protein IKB43_06525 [Fibrobacter sp.]|nr:hypothetical protein [Fibrobacter sp.]MBR2469790.1 hypothetical protein [Fibrobacter sp.]
MEGLLILIGIWLLDVVIKKVAASRNKRQQQPTQYQPEDDDSYESQDETQEQRPPRSLQDLIRQFEDAQRQATQGNIEPPTPPVEKSSSDKRLALREKIRQAKEFNIKDIAEIIIEEDCIDAEFIKEIFQYDTDIVFKDEEKILQWLQEHRIIGREMDGQYDVLVHDIEELDNLLNREQRTAQEQEDARKNEIDAAQEDARRQELERQQKLNALEERAKSARESAAAFTSEGYADSTGDSETAQMLRKPAVSTRNIADVRKGFIWAKVLDEPRFKRRWSAQYR